MFRPLSLFFAVLLLSVWTGKLASQQSTANVAQYRFSGAPVFQVFNREGKQLSQFTFAMSGASLINIYDHSFARGLDGSLAVVGSAYTDDSRATTFLASVSPEGLEQTVVRLGPFIPRAVTIASDGTIWVAGEEKKLPGEEPDRNQHLIRHYDKTGKTLGTIIPWSSLGTEAHFFPPIDRSVLVSSKDRIGWYSPLAHTYIEFSLDGAVINRFKTADHPKGALFNVALCDDGSLFVDSAVNNGPHQKASWGIYALDRKDQEWNFVPRNESWGMMYGCDDTRLATTTNFTTISWLEPAGK